MLSLNYPYVGLRTYNIAESLIFFGRDRQVSELIKRLKSSRFLAIVGTSGSGKSSLVRAGLLAKLEAGYISDLYNNWDLVTITPGVEPLQNLVTAIQRNITFDEKSKNTIRQHHDIIDGLKKHYRKSGSALLLLVDQFEEIFRFDGTDGRLKEESDSAYVQLLLELSQIPEVPIYVVLTMRSEFLGHCSIHPGLPEAINNGQYLIPRLNRQEKEEAIVGPARLFNKDIDVRLLDFVLNDLYNEKYALPLMQHFMMRTWSKSQNETVLVLPKDFKKNMTQRSLQQHIEEIYASFEEDEKHITEKLFKILTTNSKGNWVRRPTPLKMILEICQEPQKKIIKVIDELRKDQCNFLMPSENMPLNESTMIDITHESLIHNWSRLKQWVAEDDKAVIAYTEALSRANRFEENPKGKNYLSEYDYHHYQRWKKKNKPNKAWAVLNYGNTHSKDRLAKDFEKTLRYIKKSGRHISWKKKKNRILRLGAFTFTLLTLVLGSVFFVERKKEILERQSQENEMLLTRSIMKKERKRSDSLIIASKITAQEDAERRTMFQKKQDSLADYAAYQQKLRANERKNSKKLNDTIKILKDSLRRRCGFPDTRIRSNDLSKVLATLTDECPYLDVEKYVSLFALQSTQVFNESIPVEMLFRLRDEWEVNDYLDVSTPIYRLAQDFGAAIQIANDTLYSSILNFPSENDFKWQKQIKLPSLLKELNSSKDHSLILTAKPYILIAQGLNDKGDSQIILSNPFNGELIGKLRVEDCYIDYGGNQICTIQDNILSLYTLSYENDSNMYPILLKMFETEIPKKEKEFFENWTNLGDFGPDMFAYYTTSNEIALFDLKLREYRNIKLDNLIMDYSIEYLLFNKEGNQIYLLYDNDLLDYKAFEIDVLTGEIIKSKIKVETIFENKLFYSSSSAELDKTKIELPSLQKFLKVALKDYE